MMPKTKLSSLLRWSCLRVKRALAFLAFILVIFSLVLLTFVICNQDHAQLSSIKSHFYSSQAWPIMEGKQSLPHRHQYSQPSQPKQRPMVQFYPDNQNKMLYRKDPDFVDLNQNPNQNDLDLPPPPPSFGGKIQHNYSSSIVIETLNEPPCDSVHIFYYAWYANPKFDSQWEHWNHQFIPNWDKKDTRLMPQGQHNPDKKDIGANFYPQLGLYSSSDPDLIRNHMKLLRQSKVGVFVVSWYPPGLSDPNAGHEVDKLIPLLLDIAQSEGMKLSLHIEPYKGRNALNLRKHLSYIYNAYFEHPAFYKADLGGGKKRPLFYIYDSYQTRVKDWQKLLSHDGDYSIRGTNLDAIFIGLLVDYKHRMDLKSAGFDGFYTYFGANGFSYGSSWKNWRNLAQFARKNALIFIPSVSPGYNDLRVRPWNGANVRLRRKGAYYDMAWRTLMGLDLRFVSVTSFNEWHEGTQIEPAVPASVDSEYSYSSYAPLSPNFYIQKTRDWSEKFCSSAPPPANP